MRLGTKLLMGLGCLGFPITSVSGVSFDIQNIGKIKVQKPAFLFADYNLSEKPGLLVTSFRLFGSSAIYHIPDIADAMSHEQIDITTITNDVTWPNEVKPAPKEVFGEGFYTVSDGFLVPGKSNGAIRAFHHEKRQVFELTTQKRGYFYHRVIWHDMDGDQKLDIVTARAKKTLFSSQGELLWLKQPENPLDRWQETVIAKGPDVYFRLHDFEGDGKMEIVATEFFGKKLTVLWQKEDNWQRRVIDADIGSAFDLEVVDLNRDGRKDLLVTNHEGDDKASVFAYEIPQNWQEDTWSRHTLLTGIETRQRGFNQASPGAAKTFHPVVGDESGKPFILVGGDGSQRAHLLTPISDQTDNWDYQETELVDTKSTVGKVLVEDMDGDGNRELFVPAYDANLIYVFRLEPKIK